MANWTHSFSFRVAGESDRRSGQKGRRTIQAIRSGLGQKTSRSRLVRRTNHTEYIRGSRTCKHKNQIPIPLHPGRSYPTVRVLPPSTIGAISARGKTVAPASSRWGHGRDAFATLRLRTEWSVEDTYESQSVPHPDRQPNTAGETRWGVHDSSGGSRVSQAERDIARDAYRIRAPSAGERVRRPTVCP